MTTGLFYIEGIVEPVSYKIHESAIGFQIDYHYCGRMISFSYLGNDLIGFYCVLIPIISAAALFLNYSSQSPNVPEGTRECALRFEYLFKEEVEVASQISLEPERIRYEGEALMNAELEVRYKAAQKKWTDLQMQTIEAKQEFDAIRREMLRAEFAETLQFATLKMPLDWTFRVENGQTYVISNDGLTVNITDILPKGGFKWIPS